MAYRYFQEELLMREKYDENTLLNEIAELLAREKLIEPEEHLNFVTYIDKEV